MTTKTDTELLVKFDQLVVSDKSKSWLKAQELLPSQWELSDLDMMYILTHRLGLRIFFSPAFTYNFSLYPVVNDNIVYLVFFDANLINRCRLTKKEAIAVILHEFGHVTNKCSKPIGNERDADDFVRHCGFGIHLATALEWLKKSGASDFNTPEVQERIEWIKNSPEPKLTY